MADEMIMTAKQLKELHDDIRDGVSMIVAVRHYYELEAEKEELRRENEKLKAKVFQLKVKLSEFEIGYFY